MIVGTSRTWNRRASSGWSSTSTVRRRNVWWFCLACGT